MGNEVNINIRIADMQGEAKNLAKAADSDGSGAIDNAYEHSLFTQYCNNAGVDGSDYSAKYTAKDTQKAENQLIKEQHYSGGTKENTANLEQYEATWQQAMKSAYKAVGNDPVGRAKLSEFIKNKPKLQNYTSMADYAMSLGRAIEQMGNIAETDLKEFATQLSENQTADLKADNAVQTAALHEDHENIQESIAQIQQDIKNGVATLEDQITNAQGQIEATVRYEGGKTRRVVLNAEGKIIGVVRQEGAATRANSNALAAGLHEHLNTNDANNEARFQTIIQNDNQNTQNINLTNERLHQKTQKVVNARADQTDAHIDDAVNTLDPLFIKRTIKGVRDKAAAAGKTVKEFIQEHSGDIISTSGVIMGAGAAATAVTGNPTPRAVAAGITLGNVIKQAQEQGLF